MCGLAGFARSPEGPWLNEARGIFTDLMLEMEERGNHATGVATVTKTGGHSLKKWAQPVSKMVSLDAWNRATSIDGDTLYVIGHTRFATLPNKDDPDAAHPFRDGQTIGAHNGIISNWRELDTEGADWKVDSQAIIHLLNVNENPVNAFKKLRGDWAVTAVKDGKLIAARNDERPLVMAYHPDMMTLFWCSTMDAMRRVLSNWNCLDACEVWQTNPWTVYGFDARTFNGSTNRTTMAVPVVRRERANWWEMRQSREDVVTQGRKVTYKGRGGYQGWLQKEYDRLLEENAQMKRDLARAQSTIAELEDFIREWGEENEYP